MLSICHVVHGDRTVVGSMRAMRRDVGCKLRRRSGAQPAAQSHESSAHRCSFLARGRPCPVRRAGTCFPGAKEARHLDELRWSQSVLREWAPLALTLQLTMITAHYLSNIALSCHRRCCLAPAGALRSVFDIHHAVTRFPRRLQEAWALAYKKHASIASSCWNAISSAVQLRRRWPCCPAVLACRRTARPRHTLQEWLLFAR